MGIMRYMHMFYWKLLDKSAQVDGNPWILYSEERYQGFVAYLEEGRYMIG